MARILSLFPSALIAAREGVSANALDRQLRELGIGARRSEVLSLYRIAKGIIARSPSGVFEDIRHAPTASEITAWPTKKATGIMQTVALTYRERSTGVLSQTWYSVSGTEPITREQAIAMAINAYAEHAEDYNQDLIGAVHTSTRRLTPFQE